MSTKTRKGRPIFRTKRDGWMTLRDTLACHEGTPNEFDTSTNSLRGRHVWYSSNSYASDVTLGSLPAEEAEKLTALLRQERVEYVIYSYDTPIAYHVRDKTLADGTVPFHWVMPDVRYSVTTSHHQSVVRTAIDNPKG